MHEDSRSGDDCGGGGMTIVNMVGGGSGDLNTAELDIESSTESGLCELTATKRSDIKYGAVIDSDTYVMSTTSTITVVSRDGTSYSFTSPTTIKGISFAHKTLNGIAVGIVYLGAQSVDRIKLIKYENGVVTSEFISTSTSTPSYSILYSGVSAIAMPKDDLIYMVSDRQLTALTRTSEGYWEQAGISSVDSGSFKYYNYLDATGKIVLGSINPSTQSYFSDQCIHRMSYTDGNWVDMGSTGINITNAQTSFKYRYCVGFLHLRETSTSTMVSIVTESDVKTVEWSDYSQDTSTLDPYVVLAGGDYTTPERKIKILGDGFPPGCQLMNKIVGQAGVYEITNTNVRPGYLLSTGIGEKLKIPM